MSASRHIPACRFAVAALLLGLTAGCGSSNSDLEDYIAEVKSRKSDDVEPIPQIKSFEVFAYIGEGRRDPFTAAASRDDSSGVLPDTQRNKEPLEEFPLDALRMVGTLSIRGQQFALVRSPDGIVHRVTVGNHMGQNYGRIVGIAEAEITLREIVADGFGGFQERPASVALSEK